MRGQPARALDKVLSEGGLDAVADRLDQVAMSEAPKGPLTCGFTLHVIGCAWRLAPRVGDSLHGCEDRRSVQIDLIEDEIVWALRVDVPRP